MTTRQRRKAVGAFGIVAAVMIVAGVAWACTGMPALTVPADKVLPQADVTASVSLLPNQVPAGTPVDIRWNSLDGATLATVTSGEAVRDTPVTVKVPDVAPGVYYLVLTPGGSGRLASSAIEVAGSPSKPSSPWAETNRRTQLAESRSHPTRPFTAGVVLLVGGMAVLTGAFAVAGARRSRVAAGSS